MKIVIFGASGIIGQHLRLCVPDGVEPVYVRRTADPLHLGLDLTLPWLREEFLECHRPDVIINLAGESNTDVVERDPEKYYQLNAVVPGKLAAWCDDHQAYLIQVSTQAVFSGSGSHPGWDAPPYVPGSKRGSVNAYGEQKIRAERNVQRHKNWTIVRPTFVLGVRPLPNVGRANPIEQMIAGSQTKQVNDRWFSISFAQEVAAALWKAALERPGGIIHVGSGRWTRFDIAKTTPGSDAQAVSHDSFRGIAPRPIDTSYAAEGQPFHTQRSYFEWIESIKMELPTRAREIAMFLGKREDECLERLNRGWSAIHNAVSQDWNAANPRTDDEILDWYRRTESYIWELSWYHADAGFNYAGMCTGIAERLKASGAKKVLCLGDGIGDLTIRLIQAGFEATYHDLAGSRTAEFAAFRSWMYLGEHMPTRLAPGWTPDLGEGEWDAAVSLDFLEHVTDVPLWIAAIKGALKPGGFLVAQNAFAIGSGEQGSMPMHLARNDRFEKDWDPTLFGLGFTQESSNWYRAPAQAQAA